MVRAVEIPQEAKLIKLLLIGYAKAGKTHYALQAAKAGFNILFLDGEVGRQTLSTQPQEIQKRVVYMDVADRLGTSRFSKIFNAMCSKAEFEWNDSEQKMLVGADAENNPAVMKIRLAQLDHNTVLVIDSWTALAWSAMLEVAERTGSDLGDMEKADRGLYASAGNRLTKYLKMIQALRCHVIVIAHPDEYIKYKRAPGKVGAARESDNVLEWQKMIPKSSSKPHGLTMAKDFSDVLWIEVDGMGKRRIDGRPDPDREGGGRFQERKSVDEYSFANLVKAIGGTVPGPDAPLTIKGIDEFAPGEYEFPSRSAGGAKKVLGEGTTPAEPKAVKGLAALAKGGK